MRSRLARLALCLTAGLIGGAIIVEAAEAAITQVTVVNERGTPQAEVVALRDSSDWSYEYVTKTNAYGKTAVNTALYSELYFRRGDCCPLPEGQGVRWVIPSPAPSEVTITLPNVAGATVDPASDKNERWFVGRVNQERAARGVEPLEISATLNEAADRYASLLEQDDPEPNHIYQSWPATRATDAGWPFEANPADLLYWRSGGASAPDAFESWKGSMLHWGSLMNAHYSVIGVGHVGEYWSVQEMAGCPEEVGAERCRMTGDFGDPTLTPDDHPDAAGGGGDDGRPKTRITKRPRDNGDKRSISYRFTANEPSSFECKLDKRHWRACHSPLHYRVAYGRHTFRVTATDGDGKSDETPAIDRFRVRRKR